VHFGPGEDQPRLALILGIPILRVHHRELDFRPGLECECPAQDADAQVDFLVLLVDPRQIHAMHFPVD